MKRFYWFTVASSALAGGFALLIGRPPLLAQPAPDRAFIATPIEGCASGIVMTGPMRGGRVVMSSGNPLQYDRRGGDGAWIRDTYTLAPTNGGITVLRSGVRLSDGTPIASTPASQRALQASLDTSAARAPCIRMSPEEYRRVMCGVTVGCVPSAPAPANTPPARRTQ